MLTLLKRIDAFLGHTMKWFCVATFFGLMVLLLAVVFIRFFPVAKLSWIDEIIEWLMAAMIFGVAAALWRDSDHFKIEALSEWVSGTLFGRIFIFAIEILTAVFITFFAVYSLDLTMSCGRGSPVLSWPYSWWYAIMPVAGFIMLAYSIRNIIVGIARLAGKEINATGNPES